MRHSRLFLRAQGTHFHVVSRVVGRAFLLGEKEKGVFRKLMRRLEKVAGVQVLTYCLMDNHIHLLLRTEEIDGEAMSDGELVSRVGGMYSKAVAKELEWQLETWRKQKNENTLRYWRERYLARLGNLSEFMRVLKGSFSKWYNKEHERTGTLWEDRYKVVLVEESEAVLMKIAAYIDLNPVRAGMVEDPGTYRWGGYGEACGGGAEARRGLSRLTGASGTRGWRDAGPDYRMILWSEDLEHTPGAKVEVVRNRYGEEIEREARKAREWSPGGKAEKEVAGRGGMGLGELLRCRVRYLTDGVVIGSREFVDRVFNARPAEERGKRKTGARKMRGGAWGGLYSLRDLRKDVIGEVGPPG
jgi:REP element-mobilizing transposase RayT